MEPSTATAEDEVLNLQPAKAGKFGSNDGAHFIKRWGLARKIAATENAPRNQRKWQMRHLTRINASRFAPD